MLFFMVNVGHEEVKIIKGHTLAYLTLDQYDNLSYGEVKNQESVIANISAATTETIFEMLLAIPSNSKMVFPADQLAGKCYFKM